MVCAGDDKRVPCERRTCSLEVLQQGRGREIHGSEWGCRDPNVDIRRPLHEPVISKYTLILRSRSLCSPNYITVPLN